MPIDFSIWTTQATLQVFGTLFLPPHGMFPGHQPQLLLICGRRLPHPGKFWDHLVYLSVLIAGTRQRMGLLCHQAQVSLATIMKATEAVCPSLPQTPFT